MGKRKSMGVNAVLSGVKTIFSVIFPLITFPYISRVLTIENVGKYNFSVSVMTYVSLFAALGINTYAIRECSKVRENRTLLDETASEIFTINFISTLIAYTILILLLIFVPFFYSYRTIIAILSVNIAFTTMGCEWIYSAYENYLYITIRSLVTHVVSLALLFIMVRKSDDVIPYAIVTVLGTSGGNILYLIGRNKYAKITLCLSDRIRRHLKPIMTMFANTVTTSIYVNSDVIILEMLTSDRIVGLYSASAKIYTIVKNVLAAVITVSVPRLSNYWEKRSFENYRKTCQRVFIALLVIGAPSMMGLASLSNNIILLISSSKYLEATQSLQILSIALLFSIFAWFYKSCVLIPTGNEDKILRATLTASILNIALNFLLIPKMQQNAAAFTTLLAELVCLAFAFYYGKKFCEINLQTRDWLSVIVGCVFIWGICRFISFVVHRAFFVVLFSVFLSIIVYFGILLCFKNSAVVLGLNYLKKKMKQRT